VSEWRDKALAEIESIKPFWAKKYGWNPSSIEREDCIDLYIHFERRTGVAAGETGPKFVLRLRYKTDYETAGRIETFVNPENFDEEGVGFWPVGVHGVNPNQNPQTICLEGTWGFHSHHHRERDGRAARINRLLMELQRCINH